MAAGIAVVATTVGAEGLPATDGREIVIRDTPETFAEGCLTLLDRPAMRQQISANGLQMVSDSFSWSEVTKQFERALRLPVPVSAV